MEKEKLDLLVFINKSSYRVKVLKAIGTDVKIPTQIAKDSGILINHVSYVLMMLANKGLVVCINPEYRKGRMYRLTDAALELFDYIEYTQYYSTLYEEYGEEEDKPSNKRKYYYPRKKTSSTKAK